MELRVDLDADPAGVCLAEPDVFDRLAVIVAGHGSRDDLAAATAAVGGLDDAGQHLFIEPASLLSLAGDRGTDPAWLEQFDAMVAYAGSKGWTDARGRVQAHVESRDAAA